MTQGPGDAPQPAFEEITYDGVSHFAADDVDGSDLFATPPHPD